MIINNEAPQIGVLGHFYNLIEVLYINHYKTVY